MCINLYVRAVKWMTSYISLMALLRHIMSEFQNTMSQVFQAAVVQLLAFLFCFLLPFPPHTHTHTHIHTNTHTHTHTYIHTYIHSLSLSLSVSLSLSLYSFFLCLPPPSCSPIFLPSPRHLGLPPFLLLTPPYPHPTPPHLTIILIVDLSTVAMSTS